MVDRDQADALWIGSKALPIEHLGDQPKSLFESDAVSWQGSTALVKLKLGKPPETFELTGEGTPFIPKPTPPSGGLHVNVIGGTAAGGIPELAYEPLPLDDESYPDVVALGDDAGLDCSGVAIAQRWVLTARHCGTAKRVVIASDASAPAYEGAIDKVVVATDPALDLELLHATAPLPITPHARRHAAQTSPPDTELRVLGFGISDFRSRSGFGIKRVFVADGDGWGCDGSRPRTTGCDPAREIVIPAAAGHDTCNGDSGGAVFELDEVSARWRLLAITSRAASVLDSGCGMGGIYERIDAAATWIDGVVKGP